MEPSPKRSPPSIETFAGEPTRDLADWHWLWSGDRRFPIRSHRGLAGGLVVLFKRIFRPLVKTPLNDLWDRQRVFNLIVIDHLRELADRLAELGRRFEGEVLPEVRFFAATVEKLEGYRVEGLDDVLKHNDALFALLDQKLDRYRRETQELWGRLGGALARAEAGGAGALARVREEQAYVELERRFRGTEGDIEDRVGRYLRYLDGRGDVLDLGCGRGEALALLRQRGVPARGVDGSAEMATLCREKGLEVEEGDLFEALERAAEATLGGVVSFHVIEHLPIESLDRLVRLAWRALKPGGVLILETPNPLSLVVAARNFWLDPTHRRPIHPASLQLVYRLAGFEPVEQIELRPFPADERLPQLAADGLPRGLEPLVRDLNTLRDRLDGLLFGCQDYAMVGFKP